MKKILFVIFLLSLTTLSAQKEANFWYFGENAALNFNSGAPVPHGSETDNKLDTFEGCSTFSDADGNLLFYIGAPDQDANNLTVWNRNNDPMPFTDVANGGTLLNGDASSSQSALTVPAPGQPNIYYIFTVGAPSSNNQGFWYYTLDMSADGGLGDIVAGPVALNNNAFPDVNHVEWTEKVTAVRGDECNTFWVISYARGNFYSHKVTSTGVDATPVVSNLGNTSYNNSTFPNFQNDLDPRGYLKVSPDGSTIVSANMSSGTFLFDFDDVSGRVSNPRELNVDNRFSYGVEFSPSSDVLYVSTGNFLNSPEFLFQYDLTQPTITDINNSRFTVFNYFNSRGAVQLGPDNKIYWTSSGSQFISVVNNPNELGADSNYSHQTVDVGVDRQATQGLPPFLSSLLLPIEITDSDNNQVINNLSLEYCTGSDKTIVPEAVAGTNITYEWSFNDGTTTSIVATTQNLVLTNLALTDAGLYSLKITLTDACGIVTTLQGQFTIQVFEAAAATQPVDIIYCDADNDGFNTFDLETLKDAEILNGLDAATFEVSYFTSMTDAVGNTGAITIPYTNPTAFSNQTIYARVMNRNAPTACFDITSFTLAVTGLPVPIQPTDYEICDDANDGDDTNGFIQS
ncbi:hypothetical protein ACFSRZ_11790, partial [Pseudotenacibaculum haliotis]